MANLPHFMVGNILDLFGVLLASIFISVFSTLVIDKKRTIRKVQSRVLDLRLEQYEDIRDFIKDQTEIKTFPENCKLIKENLQIGNLSLEGNDNCCSSYGISTPEKIKEALLKLENLSMNGLYILDDDVLGMILQVKIYIKNLDFFNIILNGYYDTKKYSKDKDIREIGKFYFHHLSILLNNEYQTMIKTLQKLIIEKSSKPKFEHKEKDYRKIKIRQHLQDKALEKTILMNKFPHLIHGLASSCSAHFNETEEERKNTIESFLEYAIDIAKWDIS